MMAGGLTVTEDTPPDMLAGSMDLAVVMPDGHSLKMSVERSTPMMDLLVQVTTANKMSPAGFILKPLNECGPLPYKPSTPIGALDAWTIHVVPKQLGLCPATKKPLKMFNQPFEQTFRLQVHLPRNQLYVARVSPKTRLSDILLQVCSEKNLDPLKYSLRHPTNLDQVLNLHYTLGEYKLQELTLVCNKTRPVEVSSVDIMSLRRDTANPAYRNNKCEGSVSSGSLEGRSLSPVPSDESSASPPPLTLPPSRPTRKRRPAPKPPTILQTSTINEKQVNGIQTTVINHSRNSSDSSGYHEASVLSESPQNTNIPEAGAPLTVILSQSMTDVSAIPSRPLQTSTSSNSISSLTGSATGRKKKSAPLPPPVAKDRVTTTMRSPSVSSTASSTTTLDGNDINTTAKSATLPPSTRLNTTLIPPPPPATPPSSPTPPLAVEPSVSPRVAPPVPRPRSKLLSDLDETTPVVRKLVSPKKAPAPQPKPRNVQHSDCIENYSENSKEITKEEDSTQKKKHSFKNTILPSSILNSHKACVEEMTFKFDNSIKSTDAHVTDPEREVVEPPEVIESDSIVHSKCQEESDVLKTGEEGRSDAWISTSVVGPNTETDADLRLADEEIDRIFSNATENHTSPENEDDEDGKLMMSLPSPVIVEEAPPASVEEQLTWEYRLPAPPTFRDETKSPPVTEFGTVTIGNLSDVLCSQTVQEEYPVKTELQNVDVVQMSKVNDDVIESSPVDKVISTVNDTVNLEDPIMRPLRKEIRSSSTSSIYESEAFKSSRSSIHSVEQEVINELSSTLHQRSKINVNENGEKHRTDVIANSSTLENFTITTYKDMKPIEVFEDDSIKSSVGEKRDRSKDDAVFRAPKPRVKEPNLSRTSSFSIENNPNGPVIKRSVSYVSLLAANMPRHSQPYRAHLQRHRSSVGQELDLYPRLRKTSSEVNIDRPESKENLLWQDDTTQLQSVQVLRNILSRSQVNLASSIEEIDSVSPNQHRDSPTNEDVTEEGSSSLWGRSQSEEDGEKRKTPKSVFEHSAPLGEEPAKPSYTARGPPSINLSTWSERPKRQISIKNDGEYISGFGKKPTGQDFFTSLEKKEELRSPVKNVIANTSPSPPRNNAAFPLENESYNKLAGKSKSISDLSRIPIVRSVELKKPLVGNSYDQTRLKHVEPRDDNDMNKNHSEAVDASKASVDEGFIGVNSLARRFGVPQKRPVSEYFGTLKHKDLQSSADNSTRNNVIDKGPAIVSVSSKINTPCVNNESHSKNNMPNKKIDSTEVKPQSRTRPGGLVDHSPFSVTLKRTMSQPSHINSVPFSEPTQNGYFNTSSGPKQSNISSVSISSSIDHKVPSSSIYIKQSQTLDRKFPVGLKPVVKGFRVSTDTNMGNPQVVNSSSTLKDATNHLTNGSANPTFPVHKSSYNRALSTPSISINSANVTVARRDDTSDNVRLRSSSSSISQAKAEVAGSIPPPPPMMPMLKPIGERKGVKFLPPPTADPRDMLMESIRSFGKDNLKKVSNGAKSSD